MSLALSATPAKKVRMSATLSSYLVRQYLLWFAVFFFGLLGIILLVTLVDLLDRLSTKDTPLAVTIELALLKLPHLAQEVLPLTILTAALANFWKMTRTHELIVSRAAGVSIWQCMAPIICVAVLLGMISVGVINPLSSAFLGRFELIQARYLDDETSMLSVSKTGLWLRQPDEDGQSVIHAARVSQHNLSLHNVIVFRFNDEDKFLSRVDAKRARLLNNRWRLFDAWISAPDTQSRQVPKLDLATDLTLEKIQDSFAPPETISFWTLPDFIVLLENAGFSALRHKMQLNKLYATPLLFAAMILIAAGFSLRPQRRGRVGVLILSGVVAGFLFYFLSNLVFALGLSGKVPVIVAAWTPTGVTLMLGLALLLHLEDG